MKALLLKDDVTRSSGSQTHDTRPACSRAEHRQEDWPKVKT